MYRTGCPVACMLEKEAYDERSFVVAFHGVCGGGFSDVGQRGREQGGEVIAFLACTRFVVRLFSNLNSPILPRLSQANPTPLTRDTKLSYPLRCEAVFQPQTPQFSPSFAGNHPHHTSGFCGHQAEFRSGVLRIKVVCTVPQLREMSAACAKVPAGGWKVCRS